MPAGVAADAPDGVHLGKTGSEEPEEVPHEYRRQAPA